MTAGSAAEAPVDVEVLRHEIEKTYMAVSTDPGIVISNGVIDLVPDKDTVFAEIDSVLRPGGRLQIADVFVRHKVSEDARKRIDLWTG